MSLLRDKISSIKPGPKVYSMLLLAGILLLLLSGLWNRKDSSLENHSKEQTDNSGIDSQKISANLSQPGGLPNETRGEQIKAELEKRLVEILSNVEGVGKVRVMLTLEDYGEVIVLKDNEKEEVVLAEEDREGGRRDNKEVSQKEETVLAAEKEPYITKEMSAKVSGALIVCEGGDHPETVLRIVSATEALFWIPSHRIVVLKMK